MVVPAVEGERIFGPRLDQQPDLLLRALSAGADILPEGRELLGTISLRDTEDEAAVGDLVDQSDLFGHA